MKIKKTPKLTYERAKTLLDYNRHTGVFKWRVDKRGRAARRGAVAGCISSTTGYRYIKTDGESHGAHRIAWLITHGIWPDEEIDHINGIRDDNRLCNLRAVSHKENGKNQRPKCNNTSGFPGVTWVSDRRKFQSQIRTSRKKINLGRFDTAEEASAAYENAKQKLGYHENHSK